MDSNIRRPDLHAKSKAQDWAFLNACFGDSGIKFSDIDGIAERGGRFVLLETKHHVGVPIPIGQAFLFGKLIETGLFTIIVLWGDCEVIQIIYPDGRSRKESGSRERLQQIVSRWFDYASQFDRTNKSDAKPWDFEPMPKTNGAEWIKQIFR